MLVLLTDMEGDTIAIEADRIISVENNTMPEAFYPVNGGGSEKKDKQYLGSRVTLSPPNFTPMICVKESPYEIYQKVREQEKR